MKTELSCLPIATRYMAPEVHKAHQYNHMVDVFSMALIFWELLAFRVSFRPGAHRDQAGRRIRAKYF